MKAYLEQPRTQKMQKNTNICGAKVPSDRYMGGDALGRV